VRTAPGVWKQQQVLRSDGGDYYAAIHYRTMAIHKDLLVVGAFWGGSGRAYVYRRNAGKWTLEERIEPPDNDGRNFGFAVAVDETTLAVRSDGTNYLVTSGTALTRVFTYRAGWKQQDKLEGPREPGSDIAVAGDELAYGLGYRDGNVEVYVAQRRNGVWSAASTLAMRGDAPVRFGQFRSFGLAGTTLAVATRDGPAATIYVYTKR
jgi:hypothetical protein